jgi:sulfite exporter TauE/SafE
MDIAIITSAVVFGFVTGFHCLGMCGPIAVALPLKQESKFAKVMSAVLYNFGRAVTYAVMGAVFGFFGQSFAMAGFQKWIGIIMGSLMILYVIFPAIFKNRFDTETLGFKYTGKLKLKLGILFQKRTYPGLFAIGLLNGLLPCGPVYAAIAAAIATGGVVSGSLFMFLFGLGTLPFLLTVSLIGNLISINLRKKLSKLVPITIVIIGLLFVLRGLGLGIPYLSPPDKKLKVPDKQEMHDKSHSCH